MPLIAQLTAMYVPMINVLLVLFTSPKKCKNGAITYLEGVTQSLTSEICLLSLDFRTILL